MHRDSEPVVITLPEKVRRTLEKVVKEMMVKENVYGIGLFGSRSREDAVHRVMLTC
jgi:predicted nucleotidyltransferase